MKKLIMIALVSLTISASQPPSQPPQSLSSRFSSWLNQPRKSSYSEDADRAFDKVMKSTGGMGSDMAAKSTCGAIYMTWQLGAAIGSVISSPVVITTGVGVGVTYAGYKTYRYFRPTKETQAKEAELEEKRDEALYNADVAKCKRERAGSVKSFKDCLYQNRRSQSFTSGGYPKECEDQATHLSLQEDGRSEVVSLAQRLVEFAPMKKDNEK